MTKRAIHLSLILLAAIAFAGCSDDPEDNPGPDTTDGDLSGDSVDDTSDADATPTVPPLESTGAIGLAFSDPAYPCCFDYNGLEGTDSQIGLLLANLARVGGGEGAITDFVETQLVNGELGIAVGFADLPDDLTTGGPAQVFLYATTNDVDGDGTPDQSSEDILAGDGIYAIESSTDINSNVEFIDANVADGVLSVESTRQWDVPLPLDGNEALYIPATDLEFEIDIERDTDDTVIVPQAEVVVEEETVFLGGMRVGGKVPVDQLVASLNAALSSCACAGVAPDDQLLLPDGDDGQQLLYQCDPDIQLDSSECSSENGDGTLCPLLGLLCNATTLVSGLADLDTDDDDIVDAYSVGFYVDLVPIELLQE